MPSIAKALPHVMIYTDGACDPNPGPGGWAAILWDGRSETALQGSEAHTTNNRMELTAAVEALRALPQPSGVDFYTDSQYLRRGVTEWLREWRKRSWQRKGGKLANLDLWQALDEAAQRHQIAWHWVRSHFLEARNRRVDRLAREARRRRVSAGARSLGAS